MADIHELHTEPNRDAIIINSKADEALASYAIPQAEMASAVLARSKYKPNHREMLMIDSMIRNLAAVAERGIR